MQHWRRQWHPTPVLLPGKSHGQKSLVGCSLWVAKSQIWLSDFTFTFHFHALEKEMATHSSVLAWRIPGMGEPDGLPSMGLHRVGHDWSDLALACSIILYCIGFYFDLVVTHPQLSVVSALAQPLHSGAISPLILIAYLLIWVGMWGWGLIFRCHIFLPFHTIHGFLEAKTLTEFAIPFSSETHFVRILHYDLSILGVPGWPGS